MPIARMMRFLVVLALMKCAAPSVVDPSNHKTVSVPIGNGMSVDVDVTVDIDTAGTPGNEDEECLSEGTECKCNTCANKCCSHNVSAVGGRCECAPDYPKQCIKSYQRCETNSQCCDKDVECKYSEVERIFPPKKRCLPKEREPEQCIKSYQHCETNSQCCDKDVECKYNNIERTKRCLPKEREPEQCTKLYGNCERGTIDGIRPFLSECCDEDAKCKMQAVDDDGGLHKPSGLHDKIEFRCMPKDEKQHCILDGDWCPYGDVAKCCSESCCEGKCGKCDDDEGCLEDGKKCKCNKCNKRCCSGNLCQQGGKCTCANRKGHCVNEQCTKLYDNCETNSECCDEDTECRRQELDDGFEWFQTACLPKESEPEQPNCIEDGKKCKCNSCRRKCCSHSVTKHDGRCKCGSKYPNQCTELYQSCETDEECCQESPSHNRKNFCIDNMCVSRRIPVLEQCIKLYDVCRDGIEFGKSGECCDKDAKCKIQSVDDDDSGIQEPLKIEYRCVPKDEEQHCIPDGDPCHGTDDWEHGCCSESCCEGKCGKCWISNNVWAQWD